MAPNTTDLPACASQDGAHPPIALTADAGAQTGRPVVAFVSADWPGVATIARCSSIVTTTEPGTADLLLGDRALTVALAWDDADGGAPYVTDYGDATTLDDAEQIDGVIASAWATRPVAFDIDDDEVSPLHRMWARRAS